MKTYRVRWVIDIEAETPEEAALRALIVQRNRDWANMATSFDVQEGGGGWEVVDLGETTAEQAEAKLKEAAADQEDLRRHGVEHHERN